MMRRAVMLTMVALLASCAQQPTTRATDSQSSGAAPHEQQQGPNKFPTPRDQPVLPGATQFKYTVGDEAGNALAHGVLIMPWPVEDGQSFRGTWQARPVLLPVTDKPAEAPKIGPQLGGGQLSGTRDRNVLRVSLNPNMSDNNVTLIGEIAGDEFRGTWEWSTFSGTSARGKFAASRAP